MDMLEGHEDWVKEIPNSKRPRYQGPSMSVASGSTSSKGFGFNATLQRGGWARGRGTWLRNRDTFSKVQASSVSHTRISEAHCCQKCGANYFVICLQDTACYNYGGVGYLKKNFPTRRGSQGQSRRSGRPATRMNPSRGPTGNFMPPSNAPRPTATQSSVQQPRAQGRTFALTHREAMASMQ